MAFVDVLIAAWTNPTQPPPGVIRSALTGLTTTQKLAAVNAWAVATPKPALLDTSKIINAILPADFTALTALQLQQMQFLLQGRGIVDASPGTTIRAVFSTIFASKPTTLANLTALVAPFDNATTNWVAANGGPVPIGPAELIGTGLS